MDGKSYGFGDVRNKWLAQLKATRYLCGSSYKTQTHTNAKFI